MMYRLILQEELVYHSDVSGSMVCKLVYIYSLIFNSRKDMIKTKNITAELIRKVVAPIKLYNNPPIISPVIQVP
jgi:hypothetical protein